MRKKSDPASFHRLLPAAAAALLIVLPGCGSSDGVDVTNPGGDDGGSDLFAEGRSQFREGTLGLEDFWSDAVGLDEGLASTSFTVFDALSLGLQLDAGQIDSVTREALVTELATDLSPQNTPTLRDETLFESLLGRGAIVGLVGIDEDGLPGIDLAGLDRISISCALCHSVVDGTFYGDPAGATSALPGSIGFRADGIAPGALDLGSLFARASNSRALYPYMPQSHATIGGTPIGRNESFVRADATEEEFDAVLNDDGAFPSGLWDMTPDGIGNPTVMPPVYDIRPAAPYGTAGEFPLLVDAINAHVTLGLDPTAMLTPLGGQFMDRIGLGIGTEIRNEYQDIVDATGIMTPAGGFPFIDAEATGMIGTLESPVGFRLPLRDLRVVGMYLQTLREPDEPVGNGFAIQRGELTYANECLDCHGAMGAMSATEMVPLFSLKVPYAPTTLLARGFPYSDALNDLSTTYDDRLIIFDRLYSPVQVPAQARDLSAPHLTGLYLRSMFLHDGSVASLDDLLNPARGAGAPHPFYVGELERSDLIEFLTTR